MSIIINKEICMGCRICELVCSFYHEKSFSTINSIIRIKFNKEGKIDINFLKSCDCSSENNYPCIDFCPVNAISISPSKENKIVQNDCESGKTENN